MAVEEETERQSKSRPYVDRQGGSNRVKDFQLPRGDRLIENVEY